MRELSLTVAISTFVQHRPTNPELAWNARGTMILRMRGQKVEEPLRNARRARDERLRIRHWRRERFMGLGFSHADASALAKSDADLHLTGDLLAAGCAHEIAFRIVR
jgi:hypothetical protein